MKNLSEFYKDKNSYSRKCRKCTYEESKIYSYICVVCGLSFKSSRRNIKFCSHKCSSSVKKDKKRIKCNHCGKMIERAKSQFNGKYNVYCSRECQRKGYAIQYSGKNSPVYNHNKPMEERLNDRKYIEYYTWRRNVYKNDNYTCQHCGNDTGGNLVAHHILNYSEHKELRTEVSNGITLCKKCHKSFHDKYGYTNNDKEQLNSFLRKKQL